MKMKQQSVFVENVQQDSTPQKKVRLGNSTDSVENCPVEMQVDRDTVTTGGLSRENGKSCSQGSYQLSQRDRLNKDECFRTICKESWNKKEGKINQSEDIHFSRNKQTNVERKTDSEYLNEGENSKQTKYSEWNFEDIRFPDIGVPGDIQLKGGISQKYLPKGIPPLSCEKIDKEQLKQKQKSQRRKETEIRYGQDLDTMDLNFSCDVSQPVKKVSASNWKEYKERLLESLEHNSFKSPVKHFWTDGVVPLIRPEEAINTCKHMIIIKEYLFQIYLKFLLQITNVCKKKISVNMPVSIKYKSNFVLSYCLCINLILINWVMKYFQKKETGYNIFCINQYL